MKVRYFPKISILSLFMIFVQALLAQDEEPFTCFNAQVIKFPINKNDFGKNQIIQNDTKVNAFYYLYEDKYSFWYKFKIEEDVDINFSVSPSNENDRYRSVVFQYSGRDFCDKLVNENIEPLNLKRAAIFVDDQHIVNRNFIHAKKGQVYYVSVLSLNREDCGHFLYVEAGGEKLSIHAVHKPCYNFQELEVPDFGVAKMAEDDVDMEIDLSDAFEEEQTPVSPFAALTTVEVHNKDDDFVEVGDKIVLNQVFFYNNTYAFKPEAELELNQLLEFLKYNENIRIEIQGHTANSNEDIRPDPNFKGQGKEWNFKGDSNQLSEKRAEAVKVFLVERGIDKKRLKTVGYGDSQKRVANASTFEESEKNMRVEVLVIE